MADKPVIFSGPMIRALLEGRKTQTRRVLKHPDGIDINVAPSVQTDHPTWIGFDHPGGGPLTCVRWPYAPGDRLWVREAHALVPVSAYRRSEGVVQADDPNDTDRAAIYRAGFDRSTSGIRWRPSIHMPRWASRLTLIVTDVRVQRLQEISEDDAKAEGVRPAFSYPGWDGVSCTPRYQWGFHELWNSIHGTDAWDANPWVCAITFDVKHGNIDQ